MHSRKPGESEEPEKVGNGHDVQSFFYSGGFLENFIMICKIFLPWFPRNRLRLLFGVLLKCASLLLDPLGDPEVGPCCGG